MSISYRLPRSYVGRGAVLGCISFWLGSVAQAAAPVLDHVFPSTLAQGSTHSVTLVGKFDPWPPQFDFQGEGVTFQPSTNSGVVTVQVSPQATPGAYILRAFNAEGVSAPRFHLISTHTPVEEKEPNDDRKTAQAISQLPVELNGRLEKNGDVDMYRIHLEAGQTVVAGLDCYTLMSPLDPVLRLRDGRGVQVAWNHDETRSLDPFLTWTAPTAGDYVLEVFGFVYPADSDLRFSGSAKGVYRLNLSSGPKLRYTWPLGLGRSGTNRLQIRGWNLGSTLRPAVEIAGKEIPLDQNSYRFSQPGLEGVLELPVTEGVERLEVEPNNTVAQAMPLDFPGAVCGDLDGPGDEDRFRIHGKKGEALVLDVQSARLGFPLDAWIKMEDRSGKEVARNDDTFGADPRLEWSFPEEGEFVVVVGNVLQRGGVDQCYRLTLQPSRPAWSATVADPGFILEPGKTNEIKVSVQRQGGFQSALKLMARGLPEGVQALPADVPEKGSEGVLKLVAAEKAAPMSGAFRIEVEDPVSKQVQDARYSLVSTGENNGVPQGYRRLVVESLHRLWLTVLSPAAKPVEKK